MPIHRLAVAQRAEFRCLSIILGNLKTTTSGTYHAFNFALYARQFAECQYRFNRRYHLRAIPPRLARAAATAKPCPESQLKRAASAN